jgi:glyoxylase-like metal-dependent hydrolase (beta-lactamase superfamily II)
MHTKEVGKNLFLIDLETGGFRDLIASYVVKGDKTAIVETGPTSSIGNIETGLEELGVEPKDVTYVFVSHVHIDHSGGAGTLLASLPNAKVIVHQRGAPHLINPAKLWAASKVILGNVAEMLGEPQSIPEERIVVASEGMTFDLGKGLKLKAVETPGHAAHSLAYHEHLNNGVFPGDSAGAYLPKFGTVFPTTPPPFRPDAAIVSLEKLISLSPKVLFYSHFGSASDAVRRLREYEVQIKRWLNIVEEGVNHGDSEKAIREAVLRQDETIQKVVPTLKANPLDRKTLIENSVQGFIEFAINPQI